MIFRVLTEGFSNHHRPRKIGEGAEMNERELNMRRDRRKKEQEVGREIMPDVMLRPPMCCSNIPSCFHMQDTIGHLTTKFLSSTTAIANKT